MPHKSRHRWLLIVAGLLTLAAAGLFTYYFVKPHATLRVTTGHSGGTANRFVNALVAAAAVQHPRVLLQQVETADLAASAKAIEDGAADLAVIRSDAAVPSNGTTIAILRREVFAIVTPAKSPVDKIPQLTNRTVGIPESYLQLYNEHALDTILGYYDIPAKNVRRLFLPMAEIGHAVADKRIAAVLAIGPIGPGEIVDVVNVVKAATKGSPNVIAIDEADAINKRFPAFESIDVPAGAFRGQPAIPDDTVSTLAVTYRLVAPNTMLDIIAGAIAQSLFTAKTKLMQITPLAAQIEAPDPDDKTPVLPVHPGVAAYLSSGEQSFFDEFQNYFYIGGIALSVIGSLASLVISRLSHRKSRAELTKIDALINIADQALRTRQEVDLNSLEDDLNAIVTWFIKQTTAGEGSAFRLAISHARYSIEKQRAILATQEGALRDTPQRKGSEGTSLQLV